MNATLLIPALLIALAPSFVAAGATITTNVARSGAIIYTSAQYNAEFNAGRVIDGNTDELLTTSPTSYWLVPNGVTNASFILDLRGTYNIKSIQIYNTHNRQYFDRGTGGFAIYAGDGVRPKYAAGTVDRYYSFDADSVDHSGNGVDAVVLDSPAGLEIAGNFSDDIPSTLKTGQSIAFSGAGERVEILDAPGMAQPSAYTLSLWVMFPDVSQSASVIVRTDNSGNEVGAWSHQLRLYVDPNTFNANFQAYLYDQGASAERAVTGTTVVQPGVWYHVAGTAQNGGMEHLYVNGVEEGTPVSVTAMWSGGARWALATSSGHEMNQVAQNIDDLAIWFTQLGPDLIKRLANGEKPTSVVNSSAPPIGTELVNPKQILSGTLTIPLAPDVGNPIAPLVADVFSPANGLTATTTRYLEFRTLTAGDSGSSFAPPGDNVGLNELEVYADVDTTAPGVQIAPAVVLNWPYSPFGYKLQSTPSLSPANWTDVTTPPNLNDITYELYLRAGGSASYYRLVTP